MKEKQPIFIFCVNGMFSGAVAAKLMMETNQTFNKEIAMAYVMNKRYELQLTLLKQLLICLAKSLLSLQTKKRLEAGLTHRK